MLPFLGFLLLFLIIGLCKSIVVVPEGYEYTVERLGRYKSTLRPGMNFITPFIDRVVNKTKKTEQISDDSVIKYYSKR